MAGREGGGTGAPRRPPLLDNVLAARAAQGDPRAFEELVRRHSAQAFRVALRITGQRSDAEDAAQNAFLAAWRTLPEFRADATFGTWLYRIVTNHALNQVRSRRPVADRDVADLAERDQPAASDPGPPQLSQATALVGALRRALDELPPELRLCWYAREVDGYSYQDVAVIAGVSVDTARGRIFRARRRLAEALKEWR